MKYKPRQVEVSLEMDDYNYTLLLNLWPPEPRTYDYPGAPAEVELIDWAFDDKEHLEEVDMELLFEKYYTRILDLAIEETIE